jgi:hypothetical protein
MRRNANYGYGIRGVQMSGSLKLGILIIVAVVVGGLVLNIIMGLLTGLWHLVGPLAVVAGIGLIVYGLISRKPLGGGRRYLP